MIVVAIIGILAAIIIPTVGSVRQAASKAAMTSNLRQIGSAMHIFCADNKDRLPGMYVAQAGGVPNNSYVLGGGQSPYIPTTGHNRNALQSKEQLGRYITLTRAQLDGQDFFYCSLLESPRFASTRNPAAPRTPTTLMGDKVMSNNGSLIYPLGKKGPDQFSMRYAELNRHVSPSQRWFLIEIDKTTPTEVDPNLSGAGWFSDLPSKSVHGSGWLAAMYDGSVAWLQRGDKRLANRTL